MNDIEISRHHSAYEIAHTCTGCGAEHEGQDGTCGLCENGMCCDTTDPDQELYNDLQTAQYHLELANEQIREAEEARDQACAERDEALEDAAAAEMAIEYYLYYGDRAEGNGLVDAIAAKLRRARIRTALIVGPLAAVLGAAAALAALTLT